MSNAFEKANAFANLRQRAADKLRVDTPTAATLVSQAEALAVLLQLASSPRTAPDAVALLHELQVYQVELELQQEELRRSQSELEAALARQAVLVERAPVGYMTIDAMTVLCEINLAGARLLGAAREDLLGRPLGDLLAAPSVAALQVLLDRTQGGGLPETCELQVMDRMVQAVADVDTTPGRFLLVLMPAATHQ